MASWISLLDIVYPVGSIYCSVSSTSPASIVGGTWSAIAAGACLGAAGTGFTSNNYNGTYQPTAAQVPVHTHGTGIHGMQYYIIRNLSSDSTARKYFSTASGGKEVMISANSAASDYGGIEDMTGINYTGNNENAGDAYYPYQYSVYMWVRTA